MRKYVFLFMILLIPFVNVRALSISKNNVVMKKNSNEALELSIDSDKEISSVDFTLVYSNNDIVADFIVNSLYTDKNPNGIKHSIDFGKKISGKIVLGTINIKSNDNIGNGNINIYNASSNNLDNKYTLGSQVINVLVNDGVVDDKMLLDSIESKIVKIDLKKGIYEYDITIDSDIDILDLKPVGIDDNVKIDINNQNIKDLDGKPIIIKASLDDYEEVYKINVNINKNISKIEVDNEEFVEDTSYKKKWIFISVILGIVLIVSVIVNKLNSRV